MPFQRVSALEGDGRLVLAGGDSHETCYCVYVYEEVGGQDGAVDPPKRRCTGYFRFLEDVVPRLLGTTEAELELSDGRVGRVVFDPPRQPLRIVEFVAGDFEAPPSWDLELAPAEVIGNV